ncbi:MAG TPA: PspC domain-containing protein [Candidatus Binatia bacterium]|nr:PspC domain-containing protein [Candidatus Binatia bacterium]
MNEVTKIHLGRQAFTISVDAHHELKNYLEAINNQVGDKDVAQEIELRMAELLNERGVTANKVILASDVDFLKTQLGNPNDFKDDENETQASNIKQEDSKHLFRDTDNAMIAGVAAGVAQYFGIDTLLVRILFIIFVIITAGWGLLLYVVLWLLVPEAKTSSDRLRMAGKPVNVDSLKEIVEQADVKGDAHRVNSSLANFINSLFRCVLKLTGIAFMLLGLSAIFGLIAAETYLLVDGKAWAQNNIFPVGFREHLLLDIAMLVVALIASFVIIFGIAMFRRKWPIRSWVTGLLVGLILVGLAVGGALTGDVYPNVRDRYNANVHSSIRTFTPFNTLYINGPENINFQNASTYYIGLSYYGHPNLSEIKTSVVGKALTIDGSQFNWNRNCQSICIPNNYNLNVTIYAPDANQLANQAGYGAPWPPAPLNEP